MGPKTRRFGVATRLEDPLQVAPRESIKSDGAGEKGFAIDIAHIHTAAVLSEYDVT